MRYQQRIDDKLWMGAVDRSDKNLIFQIEYVKYEKFQLDSSDFIDDTTVDIYISISSLCPKSNIQQLYAVIYSCSIRLHAIEESDRSVGEPTTGNKRENRECLGFKKRIPKSCDVWNK